MSSHLQGPHKNDNSDEGVHKAGLLNAGWNWTMSTALAAYGHDVESAKLLSPRDALEVYLTFEGITGYTDDIMNNVDNCRNMEAE